MTWRKQVEENVKKVRLKIELQIERDEGKM